MQTRLGPDMLCTSSYLSLYIDVYNMHVCVSNLVSVPFYAILNVKDVHS